MHYLVTGGSGFIGRHLCERLAARGDTFTILDLVPPGPTTPTPARFVRGDVRDPIAVDDAIAGVDGVFHLAAAHHDFGIERDTYFDVNENAAHVLTRAADENGIRQLCFYSSVAIYGDAPEPHHESSPTAPNNHYGASKLAGERVFAAWAALGDDRRVLVIRPTITFGPGNFANMYSLIRQIESGRFLLVGDGANIKSLSYVENLVDATMYLWDRPSGDAFEPYNWVEKPDLTSRGIAEAIYRALGRRPPRMHVPLGMALLLASPFDLVIRLTGRNLAVSSNRIRKLAEMQTKFESDRARAAGFAPSVTLDEGIRRMVAWYQSHGRHQRPVWHIPPATVAAPSLSAAGTHSINSDS